MRATDLENYAPLHDSQAFASMSRAYVFDRNETNNAVQTVLRKRVE